MSPQPSLLSALTTNTGATIATCAMLAAGVILTANQGLKSEMADVATRVAANPASVSQPAAVLLPAASPIDPKVLSPEQRKAVETIVREYLIANPDILVDVSKALEERERQRTAALASATIKDKKAEIFRSSADFVLGNPNGDVTVVEFFDYNCGWCKRAVDEITKLTSADPKLRVVMKELPIFGENSTIAAKAAMASIAQGKYWEYHVALMKERQVGKDNVFKIAEKVGLDVARLKADMENAKFDEALRQNQAVATALGIEGTPGFLVDAKINVGYAPSDQLAQMIADVRKAGCVVC